MQETKQVAAYCRVSTLEQKKNGYGLDIQMRDVAAFAKARSLKVFRFYTDEETGIIEQLRGVSEGHDRWNDLAAFQRDDVSIS